MFFKLKKGLNLPIKGQPDQRFDTANNIHQVAVLGDDYIGLKPTMLVKAGDKVKIGTPLFEDKKNPGVIITAPAAGTVNAINRGAKRALISVVIDVKGNSSVSFKSTPANDLVNLKEKQVRNNLQKSGQWVAFRTRPYGKVPGIETTPNSIFINAMDTNPLASDPQLIIEQHASDFINGVTVLERFGVPVYVCHAKGVKLPDLSNNNAKLASFSGPHPAGLSSTHVHKIDPVNANKTVWTVGYQDVIAIGKLFVDGHVSTQQYIALGGPLVNSPRIFDTQMGANISALIKGRTKNGISRVISGSVLNGRTAYGDVDFVGRYHNQVTIIEEHVEREFMGWIAPGLKKFSALNVYVSSFFRPNAYKITTSQNGSPRAIVPIGVFEKVMPLDILATPLIKSILVKDVEAAQELGCLELIEEDLALCSFVDPGKHDFGPVLRETLTHIEREG